MDNRVPSNNRCPRCMQEKQRYVQMLYRYDGFGKEGWECPECHHFESEHDQQQSLLPQSSGSSDFDISDYDCPMCHCPMDEEIINDKLWVMCYPCNIVMPLTDFIEYYTEVTEEPEEKDDEVDTFIKKLCINPERLSKLLSDQCPQDDPPKCPNTTCGTDMIIVKTGKNHIAYSCPICKATLTILNPTTKSKELIEGV